MNNIPVRVLKKVREIIAALICKLINSSFSTGIFSSIFKCAKIASIFKEGNPQLVSNYRPISILPTLSKVIEKCIASRLFGYLNKFNILSNKQFGFLKGMSTTDAFVEFAESECRSMDSKNHCISIFLDLRKAFDTVNHVVLLKKPLATGVRGIPLKLFVSYLQNRSQYVSISGAQSALKTINVGVPQGSIIGPILFIYINDLPQVDARFNAFLYVDDTTLLASAHDYGPLVDQITRGLSGVFTWTASNRLSVNLDKTYAMLFSTRKREIINRNTIYFNRNEVTFKSGEDFLGLRLDKDMKFNMHIRIICNKLSKTNITEIYKIFLTCARSKYNVCVVFYFFCVVVT